MNIKQIREAYEKLHWAFDNQTINHANMLLALCIREEKEHRGFLPEFRRYHTADTISITDAGKLFAVKRVAEYLYSWLIGRPKYPVGKEYLHMQKSCFLAAGIVDEFADTISTAWKDLSIEGLAALDYTEFVKTVSPIAA